MILLIDNYDSFSYNLYQIFGMYNPDIKVIRNDEMSISQVKELNPSHIILSPGPGYPRNAGICIEAARELGKQRPLLGVCLGHQAICEAFGADIGHAKQLMHGKQSKVKIDTESKIFYGLPNEIPVARYHSLAADKKSMPDCLKITAQTAGGDIMAVEHEEYPIFGVQFHPESILTPDGHTIIRNFLNIK